jgi:cGMP-specific 3',5'-cyclic phosphodiesterase
MYKPPSDLSDNFEQPLTEEMVARYLIRKPNFVKRWFKDNATTDLLIDCIQLKEQNEYLTKPRASVTHEMFNNIIQGHRTNRLISSTRSHAVDYMNLNENELFFELIRDIANELNVDVVCHKILTNVSILTNSDRGSLFLARGPKDARYLVSKLFDVTAGSTLEQSLHKEDQQIIIPFGKGIAGHVASTKEYINIPDAYEVNKN